MYESWNRVRSLVALRQFGTLDEDIDIALRTERRALRDALTCHGTTSHTYRCVVDTGSDQRLPQFVHGGQELRLGLEAERHGPRSTIDGNALAQQGRLGVGKRLFGRSRRLRTLGSRSRTLTAQLRRGRCFAGAARRSTCLPVRPESRIAGEPACIRSEERRVGKE